MYFLLLTQNSVPVFKYLVLVLGKIMELIYRFLAHFSANGIASIGVCIIIFTLFVKFILLPFTIKQQKFAKVSSIMTPEIQAIQEKYKGKNDNESMIKMQNETKAVYEKYGTSPSGSCLQLLIQMPILFALYQVVMNVAAYVEPVKNIYIQIINKLPVSEINALFDKSYTSIDSISTTDMNYIIDAMSGARTSTFTALTSSNWQTLIENNTGIASLYEKVTNINSFLGVNLSHTPADLFSSNKWVILIPILAALAQLISVKMAEVKQSNNGNGKEAENPMGSSMKVMMYTMPLMSAYFCWSFASCIGIYWITSSVLQIIQQLFINIYFSKVSTEDIIAKNIEKANKKKEKLGYSSEKFVAAANSNTKNIKTGNNKATDKKEAADEAAKKSLDYYKNNAKPGSIAQKAHMVSEFNEKKNK
ncbi:MAG: YidC/Oxa1 family membrane protein insertase [Eubacterium sp.]